MAHLVGFDVFRQLARDVDGPLSLSSRGLCFTVADKHPEACKATSSVSVTSSARIVLHNFPLMM